MIRFFGYKKEKDTPLPLFATPIAAGFPSPADDFMERKLDLNELMIRHPAATFFVKVEGTSMIRSGIRPGDLLVVDRSLEPANDKIAIAIVNGDFTVKRIKKTGNKLFLMPDNPQFKAIEVTADMNVEIWGIVTYVIHHA